MTNPVDKFWDAHPSTYIALITWGTMALTAQPTIGSILVHIVLSTALLTALVLSARHEGWRKGKRN